MEGITISQNFSNNCSYLPDLFSRNTEKQITIDHVVAISNIARILKIAELT